MGWSDAAMVAFSCVMAIHMGLVDAVLRFFELERLPVVTCPKCLCFWCVLACTAYHSRSIVQSVAAAFLFSYLAVWYDLLLGYMDRRYGKIYDKINAEDADGAPDTEDWRVEDALPSV